MKEPATARETAARTVYVVGGNQMQNELMTSALQEQTGIPCFAMEDLSQAEPFPEEAPQSSSLVLYDCLGKDGKTCLADIKQNGYGQDLMLGLFNLEKGESLEKEAFVHGVRGFFYKGEPFSLLVKGVVGIFDGEFWISRQLLSKWIPVRNLTPTRVEQRNLTEPEKKMISFLADGATNQEIADRLCISRHTVKNKFIKIFRKIDVHSKTEAVLWAARNLQI